MSEFIKSFRGVKSGEIYPTTFKRGDTCPEELLAAAIAVGAVASLTPPPPPITDSDPGLGLGLGPLSGEATGALTGATEDGGSTPVTSTNGAEPAHNPPADAGSSSAESDDSERARLIAQLDQGGISYDKRWGVAKLQDALKAGKKP